MTTTMRTTDAKSARISKPRTATSPNQFHNWSVCVAHSESARMRKQSITTSPKEHTTDAKSARNSKPKTATSPREIHNWIVCEAHSKRARISKQSIATSPKEAHNEHVQKTCAFITKEGTKTSNTKSQLTSGSKDKHRESNQTKRKMGVWQ